jgi:hypothetical protein
MTARPAILVCLLFFLTGCAAFTAPRSLEDRIAYAYATHTAVLSTAASLVEHGDMAPAQARNVLELADRSRIILDGARLALNVGDIRTAEAQLGLALAVLEELQRYLRAN